MRLLSLGVRGAAIAALIALTLTNANVRAAVGLSSGIDPSNLDRTCKACDDFFQFADGGWIKKNPIPPAYPGWGSFYKLEIHNQDVLHGIVDNAAANDTPAGSNQQKVGDFYASCMDTATIDKAGLTPIQPLLDLAAGASASNLGETVAQLQAAGVNVFFGFGPGADAKNSALNIAQLGQGGLGLPDRDYYTRTDAKSKQTLAAYQAHVAKMLQLAGDAPADAQTEAANILAFETSMASNQMTIVQMRDPNATYHKTTFAHVETLAPNLQFAQFAQTMNVSPDVALNVDQPAYFKSLSSQVAALSPATLHAYLRWQVIHAYASALPVAFEDENWNFYSKELQGSKEQRPRWQRCVSAVDGNLGEALGKMYVEKAFTPEAKAEALQMVHNIKAEFREDFGTLPWMSPKTRQLAQAKLDAFLLKIGYPDHWRDYSGLDVTRGPYAANMVASAKFSTAYENAKIGKPVDRSLWEMTTPTVNAYYDPSVNEIVFPAGILQPPFFNANADMAVNYGGIGAVIGHESTHGFDDQGHLYDAQGNLKSWWTASDTAKFNARAQCIVDQWNKLEPVPGVHEIGKQIEGEEIADLGGLTIAYAAFEKYQAHHPRRIIDGFTPEQRFFMGWAQVWESSERPAYIRLLAQTDVHGYDKFRVNQTLSDMPQFAAAFFCKAGDHMVRPKSQQCKIW